MCISVLPACMALCHIHTWYPQSLEKGIGSLGIELEIITNHHMGVGLEPGSSEGDECFLLSHCFCPTIFVWPYKCLAFSHWPQCN